MEITKQDLQRIHQKFVSDPDWKIVEALLNQFLEPLLDIRSIETKGKTSDEVFAELMGRKLTADALSNFLSEVRLLKTSVTKQTENNSFK
jgi:deoxyhypusine synthase